MYVKVNFLGTGSMIPTPERNHIGILFEDNGKSFLFDCGENIQKQIRKKKLSFKKITNIFISHWHGDHVLGLSGLIQTLNNTENIERINIYGPKGTKSFLKHTLKSSIFELRIELKVLEFKPSLSQIIYEDNERVIEAVKLDHGVDCLGYLYKVKDRFNINKKILNERFPELIDNPLLARLQLGLSIKYKKRMVTMEEVGYKKRGVRIGLIFDTRPCNGTEYIAKNSDYLISEATLSYIRHSQNAINTGHMTAKEIAEIVLNTDVKRLYLTHFSQRYSDVTELIDEAKMIFKNVSETKDLETIKISKFIKD